MCFTKNRTVEWNCGQKTNISKIAIYILYISSLVVKYIFLYNQFAALYGTKGGNCGGEKFICGGIYPYCGLK